MKLSRHWNLPIGLCALPNGEETTSALAFPGASSTLGATPCAPLNLLPILKFSYLIAHNLPCASFPKRHKRTPSPLLRHSTAPSPPLPGWTTQVHIGAVFEGSRSYHVQVFRDRECLCHIVLAGVAIDAERADEVLAIRVRKWIEAFETRNVSRRGELQA